MHLLRHTRVVDRLLHRLAGGAPHAPQPPSPGWLYDPPPRLATFVQRGGRIGLACAAGLGILLVVYLAVIGLISDLFLSELVPGLDVVIDLLVIAGSVIITLTCYYAGLLGGLLIYLVVYLRWRAHQPGPYPPGHHEPHP